MRDSFFFLLTTALAAGAISATQKTFKSLVMDAPGVVMVEFFAPWCGHCKALEPEYHKAASKLTGLAKLVQVDCDNSVNKALCSKFDIKGFPTLKIFPAGSKGVPTGERKTQAIVSALIQMIPGKYVQKVESDGTSKKSVSLEEFKAKEAGNLARVLLITEKKTTPVLFKALSVTYIDRLIFGEAKKTDNALVTALNIETFPSVIVFQKDGEMIAFEGKIKQDALATFFDKYALPLPAKKINKKNPTKKADKKVEKTVKTDEHSKGREEL